MTEQDTLTAVHAKMEKDARMFFWSTMPIGVGMVALAIGLFIQAFTF